MRESPLCVIMWNLDPCLAKRTDDSFSPHHANSIQSINLGYSEAFTMEMDGEIFSIIL